MRTEILKLLCRNAHYTPAEIGAMLGKSETEIKAEIERLEKEGIIRGYKAVVDWDKLDDAYVSAIVQLNVIPKAELGFEDVAERVMSFHEVESVYLMSGSYDLNVVVKGKTLQDIAKFVARELATIDSVTSTVTNFVMRRYKELDTGLCDPEDDCRGNFLL